MTTTSFDAHDLCNNLYAAFIFSKYFHDYFIPHGKEKEKIDHCYPVGGSIRDGVFELFE